MADNDPIKREVASDHVFTVLNDGRIIDGNIVFVTDEKMMHPGQMFECAFNLPLKSPVRVCAALILLNEDGSKIIMPSGVTL